jgi:hypothetical protein
MLGIDVAENFVVYREYTSESVYVKTSLKFSALCGVRKILRCTAQCDATRLIDTKVPQVPGPGERRSQF